MNSLNIVVLGVIVAIIFYEVTNISPGGIIVPGLMVMYFNQPERIVYTIIVAIVTYLICKLISKYFVVFGKRRFALMIIISLLINFLISLFVDVASFNLINISIIGFTIPGLLANDFYKQGLVKTIPSLLIVMGILELVVLLNA